MKNGKFEVRTIIKGKDLKGELLCKVISEDMVMKGFQYKMGMNEDVNPLAMICSCQPGLHFCLVKDIYNYLDFGTNLAIVEIPDDEYVYVDNAKFRTHRLEIKKIMPLSEVATWIYLNKNGYTTAMDYNIVVGWVAEKGYLDVLKYLCRNIADIELYYREALISAVMCGQLEVVKYLHENGVDITANDNEAIIYASNCGRLEILKYLCENGADITARNNKAIISASAGGQLEMVKYLHQNGADITARDNEAIIWATKYGHTDVAEYLQANM